MIIFQVAICYKTSESRFDKIFIFSDISTYEWNFERFYSRLIYKIEFQKKLNLPCINIYCMLNSLNRFSLKMRSS